MTSVNVERKNIKYSIKLSRKFTWIINKMSAHTKLRKPHDF